MTSKDLDDAIQSFQELLNTTPRWNPARADLLDELVIRYSIRFQRTGVPDDLELCIQLAQEAVQRTPENDPNQANRLEILTVGYGNRYLRTQSLNDLDLAIQQGQNLVDFTPENDPEKARRLQNLAVGYWHRYLKTGERRELDLFIQGSREAVNLTPRKYPEKAAQVHNLAVGYRYRYLWQGTLDDLESHIQFAQEAVHLTPENHPDRAFRLSNLAIGYSERYQRTRVPNDLELYTQLFQEAVDLSLENQSSQVLDELDFNIQRSREAIDPFLENNPDRTPDDLDLRIQRAEKAIDILPETHPDRASRLHVLATRLNQRFMQTRTMEDIKGYVSSLKSALVHEESPLIVRLRAGRKLANMFAKVGEWQKAYDIASFTTHKISELISSSLERSDMQYWISKVAGLASDTTAIALRAGEPLYMVMALLELGRGIIATHLITMRSGTTYLHASDLGKIPQLSEQIKNLSNLIDARKELEKGEQRYDTRYLTSKQLEAYERMEKDTQIQSLVANFMGRDNSKQSRINKAEERIREAGVCGSIVIVNVSDYGCHALIMEQKQHGILQRRVLDLPLLNIKDIWTKVKELACPNTEMLEWLWDTVACPILNAMNFVQTPEHIWPRIWWILTGPLGRFPIHAAGRYSEDEIHATVMDRVISSYSLSVTAIVDAHRNAKLPVPSNAETPESMILVGMKDTPGYGSLQFASKEIETLADLGKLMQLEVEQPKPHQKDVLSALKGCKIFHFAGHGYNDPLDPSNSALILSDGRLTVKEISDTIPSERPFLAYLSACGTGQVNHNELIDEGLHLIGAFKLVGFQHVIGTLWNVNDESCVDIAKMTYEWMQKKGQSDSSVSEGLHHACRELRSQWVRKNNDIRAALRSDPRDITSIEELPLYWVPYVHFGM